MSDQTDLEHNAAQTPANPAAKPELTVGVIMGGQSGEHEVSLMSARSVLAAIDRSKYNVVQIGITHAGAWVTGENVLAALAAQADLAADHPLRALADATIPLRPAALLPDPTRRGLHVWATDGGLELLATLDVVFPVLHGTLGEDGAMQGLLEMAGVAYVGAGVLGSALGMDKGVFKAVMRANDIPVADGFIVSRSQIEGDSAAVIEQAQELSAFPLFVKPANLGSSVGVTRCMSPSDLLEGLYEAARFDRRVLVEQGVRQAREIEISVLGNDQPQASQPGEIVPSREFYSYEAKYIDNASELIIPAELPEGMAEIIRDLAIRAFRAIDGSGMARVDFLLEGEGQGRLYLSEVNTIPGFTEISMYPKLWAHSGMSYPALVDRLIDLALLRHTERLRTERRYHPEEA